MNLQPTQEILEHIKNLGPWFHNFHIADSIETAPQHFLGDFPLTKWKQIQNHIPLDLHGWSVLDIGCNAGFYSYEMARRGADVLGIDTEDLYLRQAAWMQRFYDQNNPPVFKKMQVHDIARMEQRFDLVLFMGVFYHLRYPMLALDTAAAKARRLFLFQSLTTGEEDVFQPQEDYEILERQPFHQPGWPKISFIEKRYSGDQSNWWIPNHSAIEAMLRSTGLVNTRRIGHEIYLADVPEGGVQHHRSWDSWGRQEWIAATGSTHE
jgi:tRNA (mo5U34)-methyltransferase